MEEGMKLHSGAIPQGYAKVSIDKILKKKYNKILLDHPPEKDKPTLGDYRVALWRGANATSSLKIRSRLQMMTLLLLLLRIPCR